jgi:hypothetical protein
VLQRPAECSESQSRGKRVGWDERNESQLSGLFIAEIRLRLIPAYGLHLSREFIPGRLRGLRWFAWFTGVVLLWFVFACGISGYWLVWDKLAQFVAIATAEWLDALPLFGKPIARNFLDNATLSGRFFTLMVFLHIAVPLLRWGFQIKASSPFRSSRLSSLSEGPLGCFSPISHCRTVDRLVLSTEASTAWLSL